MPVLDDAPNLLTAVEAALDQDYPGQVEVIISVGPSSDGSERVAAELADTHPQVRVVANPSGRTPAALNRAIEAARGEVIARVDARAELTSGYLRTAVETLHRTGADNVGGIQRAVGRTPMQRAIASAMSSRFGTGDAAFHYGGPPGPTDTVYLGVFQRPSLERVGGFDESLARNQDYELNYRLRASGGTVWFEPRLEVIYQPRSTLRALADQYWQYGRWKRVVIRRQPRSLRWRQLVPPLALLASCAGIVGALVDRRTLAIPGAYIAATIAASVTVGEDAGTRLRLLAVFPTMHFAWATGFLCSAQAHGIDAAPHYMARKPGHGD
jgi:succinoglycan biosynthesis protein ExoA